MQLTSTDKIYAIWESAWKFDSSNGYKMGYISPPNPTINPIILPNINSIFATNI